MSSNSFSPSEYEAKNKIIRKFYDMNLFLCIYQSEERLSHNARKIFKDKIQIGIFMMQQGKPTEARYYQIRTFFAIFPHKLETETANLNSKEIKKMFYDFLDLFSTFINLEFSLWLNNLSVITDITSFGYQVSTMITE